MHVDSSQLPARSPKSSFQLRSRGAACFRRGAVHWQVLAVIASLLLIGVLSASLLGRRDSAKVGSPDKNGEPLVVYCAASNKSVVEAIRADYEKEFGTPLHIQYGASQTLLAALEVA